MNEFLLLQYKLRTNFSFFFLFFFFLLKKKKEVTRLGQDPYNMLIRLMRLASEHDENVQALEIFDRANEELVALAEFGPDGNVRRRILDTCVDDIQALNGSTTGSTSVILAFLRKSLVNLKPPPPSSSRTGQ